jgi:hypothetical protein
MPALMPAALEAPFRTPLSTELDKNAATQALAVNQVKALLAAAPSYHLLADEDKARLESDMVHIAAYAAECAREVCAQSERLGQTPVVRHRVTIEAPAEAAAAKPAPARAQEPFQPQAAGQVARITRDTLKAVAFPTFVADLIRGVFDAIVKTSIQQMESFMELVHNVSGTVDEFENSNISDIQAKSWLAEKYPEHIEFKEGNATPKDGAEERRMPSFKRDLKLDVEISSLDESVIEETLVPAARRRMAESRLQMLSTLVLMGVNRIVITGGKIRATMGFHIDTTDRARQQTASDFDFRSAVSGSFGWGPWSASASVSIAYVNSSRTSSEQEINTETDLTAEVELHFKSDYFPLQRFAPSGTIGAIQSHTAVPEANPIEGATSNPMGSGVPVAGNTVAPYKSPRSRRPEKPADEIRPAGKLPDAPKPPEKPAPVELPPKKEEKAEDKPAPEKPADEKLKKEKPSEEKRADKAGAPKNGDAPGKPKGNGKTGDAQKTTTEPVKEASAA